MRRAYLIYQQWFRAAEATGPSVFNETVNTTADATAAPVAAVTFEGVAADMAADAAATTVGEVVSSQLDWYVQHPQQYPRKKRLLTVGASHTVEIVVPDNEGYAFYPDRLHRRPQQNLGGMFRTPEGDEEGVFNESVAITADGTVTAEADLISAQLDWYVQHPGPQVGRFPRQNFGGMFKAAEADGANVFNESVAIPADATAAVTAAATLAALASQTADATVAVLEEHINANLDWYVQHHNPNRRRQRQNFGGMFKAAQSNVLEIQESVTVTADGTAAVTATATFEAVVAAAANATITVNGSLVGIPKQSPNRIIGGGLWPQ